MGCNEEMDGEESEEDALEPKGVKIEYRPSKEEMDAHMLTHIPFKSWCPHCVKGKAKSKPHLRMNNGKEECTVPIVSIDYMFLGCKHDEEQGNPILVVKDRDPPGTGLIHAYLLESKGCNSYAVDRLDKTLENLGHNRIVLKSDQEPAIVALKTAVKGRKTVEIIQEESPAYESASNGAIESANKLVQDQIRAMKDALESRIGVRLERDKNIISWLVMHVAETINRYHTSKSRRYTAYEKWKGRKFRREVAEFGEKVMYRVPQLKGKDKFEVRWSDGIYLGVRDESG